VHDGFLIERNDEISERTYVVHNAASEARNVIIEHPVRDGWKLTSEVKPVETSASSYRFRVRTQPNETVSLHIGEARTLSARYELASLTDDQLQVLIRGRAGSPQLQQALSPVLDAKARVNDLDRQLKQKQDEINRIAADQKRLHDNLEGLKDTSEERQLARRYAGEMNADEDQLLTLRKQYSDLEQQRTTHRQAWIQRFAV
jgi:polyhydroxyalkanoate synthesis regulator phasin